MFCEVYHLTYFHSYYSLVHYEALYQKNIPSIIKQEFIYREFQRYNLHNDPEETLQCATMVYQISLEIWFLNENLYW